MKLQTDYRKKKTRRDTKLYAEYKKLIANPENAKTKIKDRLKKKYDIGADSTFYEIVNTQAAKEAAYYGDDDSRPE